MAIPNGFTLVSGDVVLVRAKVQFTSDTGEKYIHLTAESGSQNLYIPREAVDLIATCIALGDEVRPTRAVNGPDWESQAPGVVAAIVDDQAWVRFPGGDTICATACLHRVRTRREIEEAARARPEQDREAA